MMLFVNIWLKLLSGTGAEDENMISTMDNQKSSLEPLAQVS